MLRLPAVSGRFYPSEAKELEAEVRRCAEAGAVRSRVQACLVPHAGYVYSGPVAGAVYARIEFPKKILILGVRHFPGGERAAILTAGAWRTPLGDAPIDSHLAGRLLSACPVLREDAVAHSREHSLEVQLPFLQVLVPGFSFVPVALGTIRWEELLAIGDGIAGVVEKAGEDVLLLATSDLNHYEDDRTTRVKDKKAVDQLLAMDARGLYDVCRDQEISMCGLGPAVALLAALGKLGTKQAELVKYATSADVSGDTRSVVGYAGLLFGR